MALTITRSAHSRSSSRRSWKARSMRRMSHVVGHKAATVINPRGGVIARSGIISSTPSKPQKEGGNRGQTINSLQSGLNGGNDTDGISLGTIRNGGTLVCKSILLGADLPARIRFPDRD